MLLFITYNAQLIKVRSTFKVLHHVFLKIIPYHCLYTVLQDWL